MKWTGFALAMSALGMDPETYHAQAGSRDIAGGFAATDSLLARFPEIDAILYSDDITAVGGVKALLRAGRSIPADVAVFGFNSSIYAEISTPSLSSVNNKMYETGRIAASLLVDVLDGKPSPQRIDVPCELVFREST
jgi:LacI family transcriptional regulator